MGDQSKKLKLIEGSVRDSQVEIDELIVVVEKSNKRVDEMVEKSDRRFEAIEHQLELQSKHMELIGRILAQIKEGMHVPKPYGKDTANSSEIPNQVPLSDSISDRRDSQLGYQGLSGILATRESMLRNVNFPVFNGRLPYAWISRVERFFRLGQYTEDDKLGLVSLNLEGPVLNWYNWEIADNEFSDWMDFKEKLLDRFDEALEDEPGKHLCGIKQLGSIAEYVQEFEELSSQVRGVDEKNLINISYNRLKPEMKEVIRMKEPKGLRNHKTAVLKMESSAFCKVLSEVYQPGDKP
ncbi:uncharacterized protein LOC112082178 [Eutrema salsugineum]|uniref:uncharacterized protein LOC112082178 n=1 Tax=Eutrema salsugineum TaxID=72664 RepID=UPI000CED4C48|nr:uncharacterized protein LOC112082178 [Eutrema salsugineum]